MRRYVALFFAFGMSCGSSSMPSDRAITKERVTGNGQLRGGGMRMDVVIGGPVSNTPTLLLRPAGKQ